MIANNDFYEKLVNTPVEKMTDFVKEFCDTTNYTKRDYNKAIKALLHVRANEINRRMFASLSPKIQSGEVKLTFSCGFGGRCFCGKIGLKESTILKSNITIELIDYKGESHKGTAFNLGNECVQTFKLMVN